MINKSPVFIILALLSACAVRGPVDNQVAAVAWQQRQVSLRSLTDWGFDGRVVMIDGRRTVKMALHWQQRDEQFDIRLMSFFGQLWVRLQGVSNGSVRLLQPAKPPLQAVSARILMQQELGWDLPLDGLRYWMVGVPIPSLGADWVVDAEGRLEWLEQDGWRVEYTAYRWVAGLYMPRKIRLYQATLQVRLVLDRWQIDGPEVVGGRVQPLSIKGELQ